MYSALEEIWLYKYFGPKRELGLGLGLEWRA